MGKLHERFPHPETFTYDDMLRLFPETGPRNNVYSIIAAAMGRGELERVDAGSFRFGMRRTRDPKTMPPLPPKTIEHGHLARDITKAYFNSPYFKSSDVLIPLRHFRAAIYGSSFDITTTDRLCPRCYVIDEIPGTGSEERPPHFDILICFVDANDQAHVKVAGSWQFELLSKLSVEPSAS